MEHLHLINGKFEPSEAREILLTLIQDKINFHELKSYSSQERYGKKDVSSGIRIDELQELKSRILQLTREGSQLGKKIKVITTIQLEFE